MNVSTDNSDALDHAFDEVERDASENVTQHLDLDDLKQVSLNISASLGNSALTVREILDLKDGSVVHLNKMAGEMTDIYVNGIFLARGEIVVIGDSLHVRLVEITGTSKYLDEGVSE